MNLYVQYIFSVNNEVLKEILIAELSEQGFEGFEERENELVAYIHQLNCNEEAVNGIAQSHHVSLSKKIIEEQNWNAVWESNFQPVIINDVLAIRAQFHQPIKSVLHEIIITPKMSFGTGHHATTYMMAEQISKLNIKNKTVFDFGTGTGVLAILSEKLGAENIVAIDNDEWSLHNAAENIKENNCAKIELHKAEHPPTNKSFDVVLANINKNIITENFNKLFHAMNNNGCMLLSGLLEADEPDIRRLASKYNLHFVKACRRENWLLLQFNNFV